VLLFASVAVAVMNWPAGMGTGWVNEMGALPEASVVAMVALRKVRPGPWPEEWQLVFEKNSMRYSPLSEEVRCCRLALKPEPPRLPEIKR